MTRTSFDDFFDEQMADPVRARTYRQVRAKIDAYDRSVFAKPVTSTPWRPRIPHPDCVCGKPLLLYVPPGETAYPCHVHPERGITGSQIRL